WSLPALARCRNGWGRRRVRKLPLRTLRYAAEAVLVYPLFALSWVLPTPLASLLGATVGGIFYHIHAGTRKARANLQKALPDRAVEHEPIIKGMWRNLGRVLFEYPHLPRLWAHGRITVEGAANALAHQGRPCVFVAAHLANWECAPMVAQRHGW